MKTQRNILIAFLLNFAFSVFEFIGGIFTGSVAILSDAVHDIGDAASIGASYFLEKKSKKQPDEAYTYGYARYSVIGSVITTLILLAGSALVIYHAVERILEPVAINYNGMILFAVLGCNSVQVFGRVVLPLSMPGIISGMTMVFVPAVSTFYVSQKLGSVDIVLIGDIIERQFKQGDNPNMGAALSLLLMLLVFVCTGILNRFGGSDEEEAVIV